MNADSSSGAASQRPRKRYVVATMRLLMGLAFFVFGLNGFLNFIPQPKEAPPKLAADLVAAMMNTGYMMKLVSGTQLVVGALLLLNCFVPLALALIMPVLVNIIAFHLYLQPAGIAPGAILMAMELCLAWTYRKSFYPMLAMRVRP
jgi:uncharacterized membrane protein YphA (DoxX/SURF4 family)